MNHEPEDDPFDDDIPMADPAIRAEYETALGQFILAHSELDHYLYRLILKITGANELQSRIAHCKFDGRLMVLELLKHTTEGKYLSRLPIDRLRNINSKRNNYAHGYMDQNPFDGDFKIIGKKVVDDASTKELRRLTKEAEEILGILKAHIWFDPIEDDV